MRLTAIAVAASITAISGLIATPANAAIANDPSAVNGRLPCGYDGYQDNGQPFYNHCGKGHIVIEVDHFFWQTTYDCVVPGVHRIDQGDSRWAIVGAEYDGHGCTTPGPVVGP